MQVIDKVREGWEKVNESTRGGGDIYLALESTNWK